MYLQRLSRSCFCSPPFWSASSASMTSTRVYTTPRLTVSSISLFGSKLQTHSKRVINFSFHSDINANQQYLSSPTTSGQMAERQSAYLGGTPLQPQISIEWSFLQVCYGITSYTSWMVLDMVHENVQLASVLRALFAGTLLWYLCGFLYTFLSSVQTFNLL